MSKHFERGLTYPLYCVDKEGKNNCGRWMSYLIFLIQLQNDNARVQNLSEKRLWVLI